MYVVLAQNMKFCGIYRLESDLNSECHSEESGSGAMRRYDMEGTEGKEMFSTTIKCKAVEIIMVKLQMQECEA